MTQVTLDLAHEMQDVRIALDDHQFGHTHRAELRHSAHVVAPQVDQHEMLGAFFFVGEKLGRETRIGVRRAIAATGAGDWTQDDATLLNPEQELG